MDKGQGTTIGAIALAGLLFGPVASRSPKRETPPEPSAPIARKALPETVGDGPWIASCNYWAPAREKQTEKQQGRPKVSTRFDETEEGVDLHVSASAGKKECGVAPSGVADVRFSKWGLPKAASDGHPQITALIALVPNPLRTHMALQFDRTIDTIVEAAGDNGYAISYYWLPWKADSPGRKESEENDSTELGQASGREHEPGLLIFKRVPPEPIYPNPEESFDKVIYLFLVGETPASGTDGEQLRQAFRYEAELRGNGKDTTATYSTKAANELDIIGPTASGSAASLRAGIDAVAWNDARALGVDRVQVTGTTATTLSADQLTPSQTPGTSQLKAGVPERKLQHHLPIEFHSFSDNSGFNLKSLLYALRRADYDTSRLAILMETGTLFSSGALAEYRQLETVSSKHFNPPLIVDFPREISLLRNAHSGDQQSGVQNAGGAPGPYLPLSLADPGALDTVPHFSLNQTPLSQEAQLMAIARVLHRYRSQFIAVIASNNLDQLFLAQYLHRACPDARLIFFNSDLLFEREVDNVPFIGTLTLDAYSLVGLSRSPLALNAKPISDSASAAYYNAFSYTLWDGTGNGPKLVNYANLFSRDSNKWRPPLWVTAIGRDGYDPLAILSACAGGGSPWILPEYDSFAQTGQELKKCETPVASEQSSLFHRISAPLPIYPSRAWAVLCTLLSLLCIFHCACLLTARYSSPFTCDLAIADNDQPRRRSMYIHIGTAMLFCMAFIVAISLAPTFIFSKFHITSVFIALAPLLAGFVAVYFTFWKTWAHLGWISRKQDAKAWCALEPECSTRQEANLYFCFNVIAWLTMVAVPATWTYLCFENHEIGGAYSYTGLFFSFRCINPGSGVSPIVPVLLLLASWYLWAFFQGRRLRFTLRSRPRLPGTVRLPFEYLFFVSDDELESCRPDASGLYRNITCLLITRQVVRRFKSDPGTGTDILLILLYAGTALLFLFLNLIKSLDHFLWTWTYTGTPYEILFDALFFPLMLIAFAGWLRMIFVWGSLRRGLLERLDYHPIRHAFSRLKDVSWKAMLSQGGKHEQWRDMARSTESMRQMIHQHELTDAIKDPSSLEKLKRAEADLESNIKLFRDPPLDAPRVPKWKIMDAIEADYALFAEGLLSGLLIPHWKNTRAGLVESEGSETLPIKARRAEHPPDALDLRAEAGSEEPLHIQVAEEFLAMRYVSLLRAVLVNMRSLMMFVSAAFVLSITALNVYPFQPRMAINWFFTGLLAFLGSGVIYVMAMMHRNPILSRITGTKENALGADFYIRILSFGTVPVLTWLAYQFPDIGNVLFRFVHSGAEVVK